MTNHQELFGSSLEDLAQEKENEIKKQAQIKKEEEQRKREQEEAVRLKIDNYRATITQDESSLVQSILKQLTDLTDFLQIKREFNSIPDLLDKIEYIGRVMYEKTDDAGTLFLSNRTTLHFYQDLNKIGMPLLCPYLKLEDANKTTHEDCTIDKNTESNPTPSCCGGRYDICKIFKDRTMRAARGVIKLQIPNASEMQETNQKCLVDLEDLHDWWRQEGKYE